MEVTNQYRDHQLPPIDGADEADLIARAKSGDCKAMDQIIRSNLGFLYLRALKIGKHRYWVSTDDLVQEGIFGMYKAVDRYDPERGNRFLTYACWWVDAAMYHYAKGAGKKFIPKRGHTPRYERDVDVPLHEFQDEGPGNEIASGDPQVEDVFSAMAEQRGVIEAVRRAVLFMKERDVEILRLRISGEEPVTLEVIGQRYGISRERVRQIQDRALERLHMHLKDVRKMKPMGIGMSDAERALIRAIEEREERYRLWEKEGVCLVEELKSLRSALTALGSRSSVPIGTPGWTGLVLERMSRDGGYYKAADIEAYLTELEKTGGVSRPLPERSAISKFLSRSVKEGKLIRDRGGAYAVNTERAI